MPVGTIRQRKKAASALRGIPGSRMRLLAEAGLLCVFGAWFYNQFFLQNSFAAVYQTALEDWNTIIHLP